MTAARALAIALALAGGVMPFARAQLVDCPSAEGATGYKILLDDIVDTSGTGAGQPASARFMEELQFLFEANLEQLRTEARLPVTIVRCARRAPSDGDFTPEVVRALNASDVLLEIWGSAAQVRDTPGKALDQAFVRFALIPVRRAADTMPDWPGICRTELRRDAAATKGTLLDLFANARDVQAYAAISAGVKALRIDDYERAISFLCRGQALLAAGGAGTSSPPRDQMLDRVRGLARDIVTRAGADNAYKGPLRWLSPAQKADPCGTVK